MQPIRRQQTLGVHGVRAGAGTTTAHVERRVFGEISNTVQNQPIRGVIKPPQVERLPSLSAHTFNSIPATQRQAAQVPPRQIQQPRSGPTVDMISSLSESLDDLEVEDIDAADVHNPQECVEYVNEIHSYLKTLEPRYQPDPTYMDKQTDISDRMRAILVDWLVEVHQKFKLTQETMYIAVNIIDRYLSLRPVVRTKLQLVGITAMIIASKYEEIMPPEIRDFIYISDRAYTKEEILRMEAQMLRTLEFNLQSPVPLHFLRRYSKAAKSDCMCHNLAKYYCEVCLVYYNMMKYRPSLQAAAATYLSLRTAHKPGWTPCLQHYSGYGEAEVLPCAQEMLQTLKMNRIKNKFVAVKKKYAHARNFEVSNIDLLENL